VAWGYYLYDGMRLSGGTSELTININGMRNEVGCKVIGGVTIRNDHGEVKFTRHDQVLPILPPVALPPRPHVPMEKRSVYGLRVIGLKAGNYEIQCEGKSLGMASAEALARGFNVNSVLLDSGSTPPWDGLAKQIWSGKALDQVGTTPWTWRVVRK
jgi:hypothetical protein